MATRAVAHMMEMPVRDYVRWSRQYLTDNFTLQHNCPYLRLDNLLGYGLKGVIIWLSYRCMRLRAMGWLLQGYELLRRVLGVEVKF
jgi:hypothetical protein